MNTQTENVGESSEHHGFKTKMSHQISKVAILRRRPSGGKAAGAVAVINKSLSFLIIFQPIAEEPGGTRWPSLCYFTRHYIAN